MVENFPLHIDIETNTTCNLECYMCFQSFDKPTPLIMDPELFKKIIDEGAEKGLYAIKTIYRGEPLLYKETAELIKYAKVKGILSVMINTNATLLTKEKAIALINAGLDKIISSVDGYTKEVYEKIRIGGNFETVLKNIKRLQKIKKKMGVKKPIVILQMIDSPEYHYLVKGYNEFWKKIADEINFTDKVDYTGINEDATPLEDWSCELLWQRLVV